jgi:ribosomal protein S18 acetylase RimI-like enzyme
MRSSKMINVRATQQQDLDNVVELHLKSFRGFFLSFLGPAFLKEFYGGILRDATGIHYLVEIEGNIQGFVAGTTQPAGFYRRLLAQRWWAFGLAALPAVLKNPRIVPRISRAFQKSEENASLMDTATLMSIAVLPESQGSGIGKALVEAFLVDAQRSGCRFVNLTTDAINNDAVNVFYQRQGFHLARKFETPEKRLMNEYEIRLE